MKLLCELSKEHQTLPKAEIYSCLTAEKISFQTIEQQHNILVFELSPTEEQLFSLCIRPALTFYFYDLIVSCPPNRNIIQRHIKKIKKIPHGSIAITKKNLSTTYNTQPIVQLIQNHFTKERTVNLTQPDHHIHLILTDDHVYICRTLYSTNRKQYEQRKVQYRPFFSPISLHPKWARTMVNLSQIQKHQTLLDPFCGTGGILLEAGLLGIKIIGSDIEEKMVKGCEQSLQHYMIKNYTVFSSDISDIPKKMNSTVDAVVTDFPYGRAATTKKEDIQTLYTRAYKTIAQVLRKNGRAVIGLSDYEKISLAEPYLKLLEIHEFRVHKSLTRFFCVFQQ